MRANKHQAEITGLSMEMLVRGVYLIERQLQVWVLTEKRKKLSEQDNLDDETSSEH